MHCRFLLTQQGNDNIITELPPFFGQGDALILAVLGQLTELYDTILKKGLDD